MAAIIGGGSALGLSASTAATLARNGVFGNPATGRSGEQVYVNSATGNLAIQQYDDSLAALGLDASLLRTYNSQGQLDDDNGDNWRLGVNKKLSFSLLGDTVTRTDGDGAAVVYRLDLLSGLYVTWEGGGAHDTLSRDIFTGQWTWTDGSTRRTETYDATGRLIASRDTDGNALTYGYTGSNVTSIADASGQTTYLDYSGNNLTQIRVVSAGVTRTTTRYTYDTSNRLSKVTVDLTPQDNSISDGKTYVTTYTYDGTSKRIASIGQTDGSLVSFTYQQLGGRYLVRTQTIATATGNRTTTFNFSALDLLTGLYNQCDVTDGLGLVTTYLHGTGGCLASVISPSVSGARLRTDFGYDLMGNLTSITEDPGLGGLNRVTGMDYDLQGNLLTTYDASGSTVTRTYSATNQILNETTYTVRDPDGGGLLGILLGPAGPQTTRHVYDSENHLRFLVTADGRVTEHRYNAAGQRILTLHYTNAVHPLTGLQPTDPLGEQEMSVWAAARDQRFTERLDYTYDFRGQVSSITAWAATTTTGAGSGPASRTNFVYDQRGNLLQKIEARGTATTADPNDYLTSYTYDGLNRVLTTTEWVAAGVTRSTLTQYDDAGNRTVATLANGLVRTSTFNGAGELTSVINTGPAAANLGTTSYRYDANGRQRIVTDPTGVRQFFFYDEAGRKTAEVDGDGTLTEFVFNRADDVVKTVRYAVLLNAATLASLVDASGNPTGVTLATLRTAAGGNPGADQVTRSIYDNTGKLVYTVDAAGAVVQNVYDGADRLTDVIRYATPVSIPRATDQMQPLDLLLLVPASANDRRTRHFYDKDGHRVGVLDAAGYLTESSYDPAGHLVRTVAYANPTPVLERAAGMLENLRPAPDNETTTTPERDATTYYFYDGQGRQVGELDAEGYLTETVYDVAGRVAQSIRYGTVRTYAANDTLADLRPAAGTPAHTSSFAYDGLGRVAQDTDYEGTVTTYAYDGADRLTSRTRAAGTGEARTRQSRYDALGRVTQELTAEGYARITAGMTPAQIEAVWTQYSLRHAYDLAGRRISTTDQTGLKTVYYYDADGRLRFTVNAYGEVQESRYNALNQATDTLAYSTRIATTGLTGGLLTPALALLLTPVADAAHDARTTYTYTAAGQLRTTSTPQGAGTTIGYNAFGEQSERLDKQDAARTRRTSYEYDQRGLLKLTRFDTAGLNTTESRSYDAFGRLTSVADPLNRVTRTEYDRLGRTVATVDALAARRQVTYDAYSRTLTTRDAANQTTSYRYDDASRSFTITTPENIGVITALNRHGQTVGVMSQTNAVIYSYDLDGHLISTSDLLGTLESRSYDAAGREVTNTDGRGIVTRFAYDAANRVLTRTVDDATGGLKLVTTYGYDGQGRVTSVTEPSGRVTATDYDTDGRIKTVTVDPAGLNLRTGYTYDLEGRTLTVTEGQGSSTPRSTEYRYDTLGRRTDEIQDPTGLALRTQYRYDAAGNLTRRIDASGKSTWYVYDADNRQRWSVDGAGDVIETNYDAEGRVNFTRGYTQRVTTTGFGDILASVTVTADAKDRIERTVYDRDGRGVYSIDGAGTVTERSFDADNRVTRVRTYALGISNVAYASPADVADALSAAGNPTAPSAADRVNWITYDQRGRTAFTVDGVGAVVGMQYDGAGNVVSRTVYARLRPTGQPMDLGSLAAWASNAANQDPLRDQTTRYWYDGAGRVRFTLDGEGFLTERRYNDAGRQTNEIVYWDKPSIAAGATLAAVTTAAAALTSTRNQNVAIVADKAGRVTQRTDGEGYVTRYVFDATGRRTETWQALDLAATQWLVQRDWYDAAGRQAWALSAEGFLTKFERDGLGNVTRRTLYRQKVAAPAAGAQPAPLAGDTGYVTSYQYDNAGRVTFETASDNVVTAYEYDGRGNRTLATEAYNTADARQTRYVYDAADRVTDSTRAYGSALAITTHYDLDAFGNVIAQHEAYGTAAVRISRSTYDSANHTTRETNALGVSTVLGYDAAGNLTSRALTDGSTSTPAETYNYDRNNRQISHTDPEGGYTKYTYDAAGNRRTVTSPVALALTNSNDAYYVALRKRLGIVDGAGNGKQVAALTGADILLIYNRYTATSDYDRRNLLAQVTDALGTVTRYVYDGAGRKTDAIQAFGVAGQQRTSSYTYDKDGRLLTARDPMGGLTSYVTDALGNQTRITDANGGVRNNQYDDAGRLRFTTLTMAGVPGGGIRTENTYDLRGNLKTATLSYADGSDARLTSYGVDIHDRQTSVTDPEGYTTTFGYDAFGNQTGIVHGLYLPTPGQPGYDAAKAARARPLSSTYAYDAGDRMTSSADALGNSTTYGYDIAGNRVRQTEAANGGTAAPRTTRFTYDGAKRLKVIDTPAGGQTTYRYDAAGNRIGERQLQSGTPAAGVWVDKGYEYDARNQLTAEIDSYGWRNEYYYDAVGNRTELRYAAGTVDQRSVGTRYDLNNRRTADIDGYGKETRYEYDKLGNRTKVTDPLNNVARYYYDAAGRLTTVLDPQKFINTFKFDVAGNRTEERVYFTPYAGAISDTTAPVPTASAGDRVVSLGYDKTNQLTSRTEADGARVDYVYDSSGHKLTQREFAQTSAPRVTSYVYDLAGRLTSFTDTDNTVTIFTYDSANNRLSETQTNASDPNPVRTTVYTYDLNNRRITETFDAGGLNIVHFTEYDLAGNVTMQRVNTDAMDVLEFGGVAGERFTYDLNNRLETHSKGNIVMAHPGEAMDPIFTPAISGVLKRDTVRYGYDRVGNRTSVTDGQGYITNYEYDLNNRQKKEIKPLVQVYKADTDTTVFARPTVTSVYDDAGNLRQVIDANGNKTTSYYDGNRRMTAQINGDNVLTTFAFNAAGELTGKTLYMTRVPAAAHDALTPPALPTGEARTTSYQYDKGGRLLLTTLPPITVTTLTNTTGNNPGSTKATVPLTERHVYDAWGNEVETYDRAGKRTLSYYDVKGRKLAVVDSLGYLVEWSYDTQGNVLSQRIYMQALANPAALTAAARPAPPSGTVQVTDRVYDAASRLVRETAPAVTAYDPATLQGSSQRLVTTFAYDRAGNLLQKIVAAGTPQAQLENYYYDTAYRRTAVIDSARVLTAFVYDHNSNVTASIRYFGRVPETLLSQPIDLVSTDSSVRLNALTAATYVARGGGLNGQIFIPGVDLSQTQHQTFVYDSNNRRSSESEGGGATVNNGLPLHDQDNTKSYLYDANGNRSRLQDADGFVTRTSYDGLNRIKRTVTPDQNGTVFAYDAAGNPDTVFTGEFSVNQALPATLTATSFDTRVSGTALSSSVGFSWTTQPGAQKSWVVWDTVSRAGVDAYTKRTSARAVVNNAGSARIDAPAAGSTVYFRVVTQDAAGNLAWTPEKSLTMPPRFSSVVIGQPAANTLTVTVRFDAGTVAPTLAYGAPGNLSSSATFVLQGDGSYRATITGVANPNALSYALKWRDAAGANYASKEAPFAAPAERILASDTTVPSHAVDMGGGVTKYWFTWVASAPTAENFSVLQAQWRPVGSNQGYASTSVAPAAPPGSNPYTTFYLQPGFDAPMAAGDYELVLSGVRADGSVVPLDNFSITVGPASTYVQRITPSWLAPQVGTNQIVIAAGQQVPSSRVDGRVVASVFGLGSSVDYMVAYTQPVSAAHSVLVTSSATTGSSNLTVRATLAAAETATFGSGGLRLGWRPAGTGTAFANDVAVSGSAGVYTTTLNALAAGQYDLKLYYLDNQGREVIVEWRRVNTATATQTFGGTSQTVLARETGGSLVQNLSTGAWTFTPGLYTGEANLGWFANSLTLTSRDTGQTGGSRTVDGRDTGYFRKTGYDALNNRVAANDEDGLYREYGVDANGNVVETRNYGRQTGPVGTPIVTYAAYDDRSRKIADWQPVMTPDGGAAQRPVERYAYDALDNMTSRVDVFNRTSTYTYNAQGKLLTESPFGGSTTTHYYDLLGREVATQLSTRIDRRFFDAAGYLLREQDTLGRVTAYENDYFGRRIAKTDGRGTATATVGDYTTRYTYNVHDLLETVQQAQGWHLANSDDQIYREERVRLGYAANVSGLSAAAKQSLQDVYRVAYTYDHRGNRVGVQTGTSLSGQTYDGMGRISDSAVQLAEGLANEHATYDAYGNLVAETDAMGRTKTSVYGAFARVEQEVDEDGLVVQYEYDNWGRAKREFDPEHAGGKDVNKTYDDAGRLLTVQDLATGVSTTYTYDLAGRRITEVITTPVDARGNRHNRSIRYAYDELGRMTRWQDAVSGVMENFSYDSFGNLARVYTDTGYVPPGRSSGGNPNYRYVDHVYTYNQAGDLERIAQRTTAASGAISDATLQAYTYDAARNRRSWTDGASGTTWNYLAAEGTSGIDANGRVASAFGGINRQRWEYDGAGNVLGFHAYENGVLRNSSVSSYNPANVATVVESTEYNADGSRKSGNKTTTKYDLSQRAQSMVMEQDGKTFTYTYTTLQDGRETRITAAGKANGTSTTQYDANKIRKGVDRGRGDGMDRNDTAFFVADNEGHILYEYHDDGKAASGETREYFYANGNPVAQSGVEFDGSRTLLMDQGDYGLVTNTGSEHPGALSSYTVRAGDTLQSIAGLLYGNPSLWFVLADANGIDPSQPLKEGRTLQIPSTIRTGSITADNHAVYNEGNIVGSTLPNLKSPPPKKKNKCAAIAAIIVTVIVAVVVSVVTVGIAAPAAAAGTAAVTSAVLATTITLSIYAAVGAAVAVLGSFVRQGILIGIRAQDKFSWRDLGADAAVGGISGLASGVGAVAGAAAELGKLSAAGSMTAKVAAAALEATSAATGQLIRSGKITSWTSLAASAVGGYVSAGSAISQGEKAAARGAEIAATTVQAESKALQAIAVAERTASVLGKVATVSRYVTPWVQVAESYVRDPDKVTALDWISAAGNTLADAAGDYLGGGDDDLAGRLRTAGVRTASNALTTGAIALVDRNAALQYFAESVGHEVGFVVGDTLGDYLRDGPFARLQQRADAYVAQRQAEKRRQADANGGQRAAATAPRAVGEVATSYDPATNTYGSGGFKLSLGAPGEFQLSLDPDGMTMDEILGAPDRTVTVKSGQSLSGVTGITDAQTLDKIAEYNGLPSRHEIRAGQSIVIPDAATLADIQVSDARRERGAAGAVYYAKRQEDKRAAAAEAAAQAVVRNDLANADTAGVLLYTLEGGYEPPPMLAREAPQQQGSSWDGILDGAADYVDRSFNQLLLGNYTEDVTLLGTAMQIGTGIVGVDLPADIRDLTHDVTHWEWTWGHAGQTALDAIGLVPGIGVVKNVDEAAEVLSHADEAVDVVKAGFDSAGEFMSGVVGVVKSKLKREPGVFIGQLEDEAGGVLRAADVSSAGELTEGVRRLDFNNGEAVYTIDEATGLTLRAEGQITGPHRLRIKGQPDDPLGGLVPGEHRGHLIPEGGVDNPAFVNLEENIISETAASNLGLKKSLDYQASKLAAQNPGTVVKYVSEPIRFGDAIRPSAVTHYVTKDDEVFGAVSILNGYFKELSDGTITTAARLAAEAAGK